MDSCRADHIVVVARIEDRQIDMLIHQAVDGVLERPRDQLILERNREHDHLIFIAGFVFCHGVLWHIKPHRAAFVVKFPRFFDNFNGVR